MVGIKNVRHGLPSKTSNPGGEGRQGRATSVGDAGARVETKTRAR
jgi:hypothetical protein